MIDAGRQGGFADLPIAVPDAAVDVRGGMLRKFCSQRVQFPRRGERERGRLAAGLLGCGRKVTERFRGEDAASRASHAAVDASGRLARRLSKTATRVLWKWTQPRTACHPGISFCARNSLRRQHKRMRCAGGRNGGSSLSGARKKAARADFGCLVTQLGPGWSLERPSEASLQGPLWRRATQQGTCVCPCHQLRED